MEKSVEELYNERLARLKTAISLKEPDCVPMWFPADTWVAHYSGYNIQEILYDYEKLIGAINKVLVDFDWDAVFPPFGTWPAPVLDAIGQRTLMVSGQDVSATSSFQFPDASPMQAEDYPEFIADPYAFIVEKLLPRRATELAKPFPRNELRPGQRRCAIRPVSCPPRCSIWSVDAGLRSTAGSTGLLQGADGYD